MAHKMALDNGSEPTVLLHIASFASAVVNCTRNTIYMYLL